MSAYSISSLTGTAPISSSKSCPPRPDPRSHGEERAQPSYAVVGGGGGGGIGIGEPGILSKLEGRKDQNLDFPESNLKAEGKLVGI